MAKEDYGSPIINSDIGDNNLALCHWNLRDHLALLSHDRLRQRNHIIFGRLSRQVINNGMEPKGFLMPRKLS